jgi:F0F1-type ATP synthase assembly protein I
MEGKEGFLNNILFAFNIGWIMAGSVLAGFLIGKWLSDVFNMNWIVIFFPLIGAGSGMLAVWKYYSKR